MLRRILFSSDRPGEAILSPEAFIQTIDGFGSLTAPEEIPYLVYYITKVRNEAFASVAAIADLRTTLHLRRFASLANHLSEGIKDRKGRPARYVKVPGGYVLERNRRDQIDAAVTKRPTAVKIAADLRSVVAKISNAAVKDYFEEAVGCFEAGLHRAAMVFAWSAAYSLFRQWLLDKHLGSINATMAAWKHPQKIAVISDFEEHKEDTVLTTARTANVISKEQHKTLKKLLDERNSFAHPTLKKATSSQAEAFIETILNEVVNVYV